MIAPDDLAADAESLHAAGASAARCRSVVSRAYYAAYHACDIRAKELGYLFDPDRRGGTHEQLHKFMRQCGDSKLRRAFKRLKSLYTKRIDADYRLFATVGINTADEALEDMSEVVDALKA
jgi:uncharacterized protein (UPF0332 family)